jgi:glucosyl-3-phosphoglycerate synthase
VTELTVRPLINLLFPELSFFVQPLAGEFAMLRQVAEQIPFSAGYAVDVGMLVDILYGYGLQSMAQVGMGERIHRNRDLHALSQEAFEICRCLLVKASMSKAQTVALRGTLSRSLVQFSTINDEFVPARAKLNDHERPPIATVSEYVLRHGISKS